MKRNQIKSTIDNTQAKQETKYECAKGVTKNLRTAYFFKSGGCPDLLMVSTPANSLQQQLQKDLETSDERHEMTREAAQEENERERGKWAVPLPALVYVSVCNR
jgi:hypothetical protein